MVGKLNGISPSEGTVLGRGNGEFLTVLGATPTGVTVRYATVQDFHAASKREPQSLLEHSLLPVRPSVFGPIRIIGPVSPSAFICKRCAEGAHSACKGGTQCDCQHRSTNG